MAPRDRRQFGSLRKLPSGRWQATYSGTDGRRYKAPRTFSAKGDAEAFLNKVDRAMDREEWTPGWPPPDRPAAVTFGPYAADWLANRTIKPRTREHYQRLLDKHINPTFGDRALNDITPADVRAWHTALGTSTPTQRSHAYGLLRTIFGQAVADQEVSTTPCHIRGAGNAKRKHQIVPASPAELGTIAAAMPDRLQAIVLLAAWCGLRFGELTELRRKDVDLDAGVLRVRRAVVRVDGGFEVGTPKSDAGIRDVVIPPHLTPAVRSHLDQHVTKTRDALLFPATTGGRHLATATLSRHFYKARAAAGRDDLRFHDLRHTQAVMAAAAGATLAELMARLGHSTPAAAMRYQHAARDRDREIAAALSKLAQPDVGTEV